MAWVYFLCLFFPFPDICQRKGGGELRVLGVKEQHLQHIHIRAILIFFVLGLPRETSPSATVMAHGKVRLRSPEGGSLLCVIGDEDTVTGFLLAGVGEVSAKRKNFLIVDNKTKLPQIEDAFKEFTSREDVAVLLISQHVANDIRHLLDEYDRLLPTILEIPSKGTAYDMAKDSLMTKVLRMLGTTADAPDVPDAPQEQHL